MNAMASTTALMVHEADMSSAFKFSDQQLLIAQFVANGSGNGIVIARAGCGKTFLLRKIVPLMKPSKGKRLRIFIGALNRDIANEIEFKIREDGNGGLFANGDINTFHSHGMNVLRKIYPKSKIEGKKAGEAGFYKFDKIAEDLQIPVYLQAFAKKAMSFAMQRGFGVSIDGKTVPMNNPALWMQLVEDYGLDDIIADDNIGLQLYSREDLIKQGLQWAAKSVTAGMKMVHEVFSFEDMLYAPLRLNAPFEKATWFLTDEAQDTNPLRREMAARMTDVDGRMIWVGDDRQGIYLFAGADNDALDTIEKTFRCKRFYMTETRRCCKAVVRLCQTLVPDFKAHESNPEGEVSSVSEEEFFKLKLNPSDAIICRNTRPLVSAAYQLIKNGTACHVEGKEIGKGLTNLIGRWKSIKNLAPLRDKLNAYLSKEVAKFTASKNDAAAEAVSDRVETIFAIMDGLPKGSNVESLKAQIDSLFENTPKGQKPKTVSLMTAHRSKGLEFDTVYGLGVAVFFPSRWAKTPAALRQEENLLYVSYSRAINKYVDIVMN